MKICLFILLNVNILAQPIIIDKKIIDLNQPLAYVHKIKKINTTEFGAVGETINETGHRNIFFAKFNYDSLIFSKSYHSETSLVAQDFKMSDDSSFIIVGDNAILKISNIGDSIWLKNINTVPNASTLYSIVQVEDTNLVACGYIPVFQPPYLTYYSIWVIKFNLNGEIIWQKFYGGATYYLADLGTQLIRSSDEHFFITGSDGSIFLLKIDFEGNQLFFNHYNNLSLRGGTISYDLKEGLDSSYYITGSIPIWNNAEDILLIKTDNKGDTLFVKNYNGNPSDWNPNTSSGDEYGVFIKIINRNNVILGGNGLQTFTNDPLKIILRLDSFGNVIWKQVIESQNFSRLSSIEISNENKLIYLGVEDVQPNKIFIVTTSYDVTDIKEKKSAPTANILYQNYPNPFNPITKIKYSILRNSYVTIKIYDLLGNEIETLVNEEKSEGIYSVVFSARNLSSGIYFYRMQAGNFSDTKKFIILK